MPADALWCGCGQQLDAAWRSCLDCMVPRKGTLVDCPQCDRPFVGPGTNWVVCTIVTAEADRLREVLAQWHEDGEQLDDAVEHILGETLPGMRLQQDYTVSIYQFARSACVLCVEVTQDPAGQFVVEKPMVN